MKIKRICAWVAVVGSLGVFILMAVTGEWLLRAVIFLPFVFLWGVFNIRAPKIVTISKRDMNNAGIEEIK